MDSQIEQHGQDSERVSVNPGGLDEHRPLTTADLPAIAEYVKGANKPSSSSRKRPASKSKSGGKSK